MSNPTKKRMGVTMAEIRESIGLNQEELGHRMGKSQQTVSRLEQQEAFTEAEFEEVLEALEVKRPFFERWKGNSGSMTVHHIQDHGKAFGNNHFQNCFNVPERILELEGKNEKLYERLLEAEKEKVVFLQRLLDNKSK
ncbi:helix-turn-helix domain-containing protein [Sinomicrobium weinanense]|uniref:Helix-turn-helix transcriptional regulator n=1 Tax=Sinomicrobium weinanense TaxID=2842200 RepID=A0A926JUZ0_9FLAO|nr:helix-turn-helix transcriptional regulator [Sinomicrobium weinanense]MBC9797854.1 helix-turn-helix transcriptional regulator [Sinomicrobium weinanense]MBU3122246.1 helix-turn-helix transcriptional regulator [Sinomicrobium weinanense]